MTDPNAAPQVLLAQPRGFCAGVDRAIEIVERALAQFGAPIYVRHEIVHNDHVVGDLRGKGAVFVDDLAEVPAGAVPLELDPQALQMTEPPCRLYIIGYPGGRDIEFALHDNQLLALNPRLIHYRTPTEGGSSGSPVFGPSGWRVVALHHAGRKDMPRIDGKPGTYEANEGISIQAIKTKIAASPIT